MRRVVVDLSKVTGWDSFHDLFADAFGFPAYYGRNMDAWIDCMEDFAIEKDLLILDLPGMADLKLRCPEICEALNECSAFINHRSLKSGGKAQIALCYGSL